MDLNTFLECQGFTRESFESTGLKWSVLEEIHELHVAATQELRTTAGYITERLQLVPAVHSLNVRIKHPEHLIAKIIRKKLKDPELTFEVATYEERITDLIGIRALHLFKEEWAPIHRFVTTIWDLHETPIAYVRAGDPEAHITAFKSAGCQVEEHPLGYRSIHYLIKSQPAKRTRLAELQVRTIFEEGWSEIDHRVRYPRHSGDPYLAELLTIFNRLAGSADEMGSFTKLLSSFISEQAAKEADRQKLLNQKEDQLRKAISQLAISESAKRELEEQITELRQSSLPVPFISWQFDPGLIKSALESLGPFTTSVPSSFSSALDSLTAKRVSEACGKEYNPTDFLSSRCGDCVKELFGLG